MEDKALKIYEQAIEHYGKDLQLDVAIEEMSELIKEIVKYKRGADNVFGIIEEMADVHIMLEQLRLIFGIPMVEINLAAGEKLDRLRERLEAEQNEKR